MSAKSPDALYELRARFEEYDADSDGRIEFAEFCQLMAELDDELSREECQLAFQGADGDDDGSISFDEFAAWWTGG
ncbi:MAG TPA: EF-hand domain-containing protein [Steroidobacteraceae bacterium]|nr:EF-hand domain-containing protein [Steroidobacteraceae bacterium]HNS26941.1 EF-hand domain-containing protein [Steroidobacteraceae bacterium]